MKQLLLEAPVPTYPDSFKLYISDKDASNITAGAVFLQMVDREERVVAYYSKTFRPPQRNYFVTNYALLLWFYKQIEKSHYLEKWLKYRAKFNFLLEH